MRILLSIAKRHWGAVLIVTLCGAVGGMWLSMRMTPLYASNSRVLIVQTASATTDAYTALRASERLGNHLSHIVMTSSFLDHVLNSGFSVRDTFPADEDARRDQWADIMRVSMIPETSILDITALHADRAQAERIVAATNWALLNYGKEYVGIETMAIQVVDAPLTSLTPVQPRVPINVAMGALAGFIISVGFTLLRESIHSSHSSVNIPVPHITQGTKSFSPPTIPVRLAEASKIDYASIENIFDTIKANKLDDAANTMSSCNPRETIRTMHDHAKTPFGGQYFFQHKLISLDDGEKV